MIAKVKGNGAPVDLVLPRIRTASLADQTTSALLDAILERKFPGDRLPSEPELAEMLNVSRTTLRAALQSLERLGMVSRAPGRGTVIRTHIGRESIILQRLIGFRAMLKAAYKDVQVVGNYHRERPVTLLGLWAFRSKTPRRTHIKAKSRHGEPVRLFDPTGKAD